MLSDLILDVAIRYLKRRTIGTANQILKSDRDLQTILKVRTFKPELSMTELVTYFLKEAIGSGLMIEKYQGVVALTADGRSTPLEIPPILP
jgi:hypothetical protein